MSKSYRCVDCHKEVSIGSKHKDLSCRDCHLGVEPVKTKKEAHVNLFKEFTVEKIERLCQRCHFQEVKLYKEGSHYHYKRELQSILRGFNIKLKIQDFSDLVDLKGDPSTREGLLLDFLKRRCLTCHIWSKGENYAQTSRERGCFSCHKPHSLTRPKEETCLSCHYSTRIGWDYYGLFPHNWALDYRSPLIEGEFPARPFGIEAYNLTPDVHKMKGLTCLNCHPKEEVMYGKRGKTCNDCHKKMKPLLFHNPSVIKKIKCEACHSNYLSQDRLKICSLESSINFEEKINLMIQESREIEDIFTEYLRGNKVQLSMTDKFNGEVKEGIWFCTLSDRQFTQITLGRDEKGRICVLREETLIIKANNYELRGTFRQCKTVHSIGRGDLFRAFKLINDLNQR